MKHFYLRGKEGAWIALLFFLFWSSAIQAQTVVSGTVTSQSEGETLPGVNVVIKGTTTGTITDGSGAFSLSVPNPETAVLQFTYIGFETKEVPVNNRSTINVQLVSDLTQLEEVVVVGYGEQSRRRVTGAISQVESDIIEGRPTASIENILQGTASGVAVTAGTGQPGAPATIRIRGAGSFTAGNDPLYVIDGVPVISNSVGQVGGASNISPLADLNPNDIESIDILKDAASASIYGSRASNGVVLITTKKGRRNTTQVDVNVYTGTQRILRNLPTIDSRQTRALFREKWVYGWQGNASFNSPDPVNRYRTEAIDTLSPNMGLSAQTDYQNEVFDNAPITNADVSVRGGSDKLLYSFSGQYFDQQGILLNTGFRRYTGRVNVDYQTNNWLKMGVNVAYSNTEADRTRQSRGTNGWYYFFNSPAYVGTPDPVTGLPAQREPMNILREQELKGYTDRVFGNVYAEVQFFDELRFRSNFGVDVSNIYETEWYPSTVLSPGGGGAPRWSGSGTTRTNRWINENYFTYAKTFATDHDLNVIVGMSLQQDRLRSNYLIGTNGPTDKITTANASSVFRNINSFETSSALVSYYARASYAYKFKYLLSASFRVDGSSRFGEENRYANFPSVSLGWVVSEEGFLQDVNWLDLFKVRAAWGQTGNQEALGDFQALGQIQPGYNYVGSGIGPSGNGIPNAELVWEESNQLDIGFDLGLFNRIGILFDWYRKETNNLLLNRELPASTGYNSLIQNIGSIENSGIDIEVNADILRGPVQWTLGGNISFLDSEVKSLAGDQNTIISFMNKTEVGQPLGEFFGYEYAGVYSTPEDVPAGAGANGNLVVGSASGTEFIEGNPAIVDQNNDGIINADDRVVIGNAIADFTGGITNRISWKGIEFNTLFTFSKGNDIFYNDRSLQDNHTGLYRQATPEAYNNRWLQTGDVTNWPRVSRERPMYNTYYRQSSQFVEDGSFIRLRNITLAYNFPQDILDKIHLRKLRVYATGENLRVWTDFSGFDPEQVNLGNPTGLGIQNLTMPTALSFIFGVNIGL